MANKKPHMCGRSGVHLPDTRCDCCQLLEERLNRFEQYVRENYYTKEEVNELIATARDGGYKYVTELPATGEDGFIYIVPNQPPETGHDQWIWTVDDGWVNIGKEEFTLDKESILTALGYEEMEISMTDENDETITRTVIRSIE